MIPKYDNLKLVPGVATPGISKIQIAAKEWLATDLVIDITSGSVSTAIALISGKSFYELEFAPLSYDYEEKPKQNKSGPFVETTVSGQLNDLDAVTLRIIESYRRSEFIVIATDRKKRKRVIGNQEFGAILTFSNKNANNPTGNQKAEVALVFDSENYAPYYI